MSPYRTDPEARALQPGDVVALVKHEPATGTGTSKDDSVLFILIDDTMVRLRLVGDCCSRSYFADPKQFDELLGARILDVEERDDPAAPVGDVHQADDDDDDVVRTHFLVFKTTKGHVTIDWRNASNGYYDGELKWEAVTDA